ncbi:unnamed protein product [Brachionus calyciflorus]|uniref:Uncharacterized protein n=1 Tax=Brachionus calyciflorus TaxID=104777 RepID=A0A813U872_9BILA|nr:unnamed protein product [Brachionus calyciflorus]
MSISYCSFDSDLSKNIRLISTGKLSGLPGLGNSLAPENKSLSCQKFTLRELNLLKVILTCGLYPQVAIADEFNSYKRDSDQMFHSKHKAFVAIHPTSIFSYDPDILQPCNEDGFLKDNLKFSTRHQLLVYVNLFETNKAYFMNCMRVPALQTLLLYSRSLDTNEECTRILCDEWLEILFLDSETAQKVLSAILYLRSSIEKLFKIRLEDRLSVFSNSDFNENELDDDRPKNKDSIEFKERARKLEKVLKKKLSEFLDSSVMYSVRRVLPAEMNKMFVKNYQVESKESITDKKLAFDLKKQIDSKESKVNEIKSGFRITDYLTYNCIVSDATLSIVKEYSGNMKRHWKCSNCSKDFLFDLKERMEHEVECQAFKNMDVDAENKAKKSKSIDEKDYFCKECNKNLSLTAIEILKHKRSHLN